MVLLSFSTFINLNIYDSSRNMYLYYFNGSDNKFKRLAAEAFFITYRLSKKMFHSLFIKLKKQHVIVLRTLNSRPVPRGFELRIFNISANFKKFCSIIQTAIYMFNISYRNTETRLKICFKSKDRQNNVRKLRTLR